MGLSEKAPLNLPPKKPRAFFLFFSQKHEWLGLLWLLSGCLLLSVSNVGIKLLAGSVDIYFIAWVRFLVGVFLVSGLCTWHSELAKIRNFRYLVWRGFFGAAAIIFCYLSIKMTSSGRGVLLTDTNPLFVFLLCWIFKKETIRPQQMAALLLSGFGIYLVFYDHSHYPFWGNFFGLLAGVTGGIGVFFLKKVMADNNVFVTYLFVCLFGLVFCSFSVPHSLQLTPVTWMFIFAISVLTFVSQLLMTQAFKYVTALQGSLFSLSDIPFTIFISLFIAETMKTKFFIGAILIVAGLVVTQVHRAKPGNQQASTANG